MIRSGNEYISYTNTPNYTLSSGSGVRVYDSYVLFKQPFTVTPEISVSIHSLDMDRSHNDRIYCSVKDVTPYGFTLRAETWADSLIYAVGMDWIAYTN